MKKNKKPLNMPLKIIIGVVCTFVLVVVGYLLYVLLSYSRIPDMQQLEVINGTNLSAVKIDTEYTIVTQNIGFGAYTDDFTFFMDGGTESRAKSAESVKGCINSAISTVNSYNPDFILFQEVDLDSTRSHHIDQSQMISDSFKDYSRVTAVNYHSAYLFYPIFEPHGASNSSMMTLSRYNILSSIRRSFPISTSFSKFLDLDRCYSVSRLSVENGKELVIYNVHSSAYGGNDEIRTAQMTMLLNDMKAEYDKGNYVVCGGDFNHDFTGNSTQILNGSAGDEYGWAQPFPENLIPKGISRCISYKDGKILPTCRNCDVPYKEGNYTIIVDGFLVSDNVECVLVENVATGFKYSDHNPVVMKFKLK